MGMGQKIVVGGTQISAQDVQVSFLLQVFAQSAPRVNRKNFRLSAAWDTKRVPQMSRTFSTVSAEYIFIFMLPDKDLGFCTWMQFEVKTEHKS